MYSNTRPLLLTAFLLIFCTLFITLPVRAEKRLSPDQYQAGMVIVKTKKHYAMPKRANNFSTSVLSSTMHSFGISSIVPAFPRYNTGMWFSADKHGLSRIYKVRYNDNIDPYEVCALLERNPDIEYASPIFKREIFTAPNDPRYGSQWYLNTIEAEKAWNIVKGKASVIIAIIDSGVDWEHEDLRDNIWQNTDEIPNNNVDDDANGFVDDVRGWDFVGDVSLEDASNGLFAPDNDPKLRSSHATTNAGYIHGTRVAGCAAATPDNNLGVAGIGGGCTIMPLKIASGNVDNSTFQEMEAILYAAENGADIINCSWGGTGFNPAEQDIINQAVEYGSIIIAASGNWGRNNDVYSHTPSNYDNVFFVGSTNQVDEASNFSNYGRKVDVYAPGEGIMSTIPANFGGAYTSTDGTSMSSAIVAGVAGLIKSLHPDWTAKQIWHQLRSTSEDVVAKTPEQRPQFYGRVNAFRAVNINQSFDSGDRLPGVGLAEGDAVKTLSISNGPEFDTIKVEVTFTNYLAPDDIEFELQPLYPHIDVLEEKSTINNFGTLEDRTTTFTLIATRDARWLRQTEVSLVFNNKAGTYTNFELIDLDYAFESTDEYVMVLENATESFSSMTWGGASTPDSTTLWVVGNGILQSSIPISVLSLFVDGEPPRIETSLSHDNLVGEILAVFGFDEEKGFIAVNENGKLLGAKILRISNVKHPWGWKPSDVTSFTSRVTNMHFFDEDNGIFIGDAQSSAWGVGRSLDGGQTWFRANGLTNPKVDEKSVAGSMSVMGDSLWFGTTNGRIFFTTDQGATWTNRTIQEGREISSLAFINHETGFAIASNNTSQELIRTTDNGKTWERNVFTFSTLGMTVSYLYTTPGTNRVFAIGESGSLAASDDNGATWNFIRTVRNTGTQTGAAFIDVDNNNLRLWGCGKNIGYHDTKLIQQSNELDIADTFDFQSVAVETTTTGILIVENATGQDVTITALTITDAVNGTFDVSTKTPLPVTIPKSMGVTTVIPFEELTLSFTPTAVGNASAVLTITAGDETYEVQLLGIGIPSSKVLTVSQEFHDYGTVSLGDCRTEKFYYVSAGDASVAVEDMTVSDPSNFAVTNISPTLPAELSPGDSLTVEVRFCPLSEGKKEAQLTVNANVDPNGPNTTIELEGNGTVTSVEEEFAAGRSMEVFPNPISDSFSVRFNLPQQQQVRIELVTLRGHILQIAFDDILAAGTHQHTISTDNIPSGSYICRITTDETVITSVITIIK